MADKTYVAVSISVKDAFDNKHKSSLPKDIKESFNKAIDKSSKLTSKQPSDKKAESLSLDGGLSLTKTKKGIEAKISIAMAKDRSIFGTANSQAAIELDDPDKVTDSDVDDLVQALLKDVQPKVIKELEKKAK
jgi:hypothetical protein